MIRFAAARFAWTAGLFLAATLFAFATTSVGGRARGAAHLQQAPEFVEGSWYERYARFLWDFVAHGSLGNSLTRSNDRSPLRVADIVWPAAATTGSLVGGAILLSFAISLAAGLVSLVRSREMIPSRALRVASMVVAGCFVVVSALVLSYVVGYRLRWTPVTGYCDLVNPDTACGGLDAWLAHLLIPCLVLALVLLPQHARILRAALIEAATDERALPQGQRSGGRAARKFAAQVVRLVGVDAGWAIGPAIFVETAFGFPGLGNAFFSGFQSVDPPLSRGALVVATLLAVGANFVCAIVAEALRPGAGRAGGTFREASRRGVATTSGRGTPPARGS